MYKYLFFAGFMMVLSCFAACAEGPLWRTGSYAPWVQEKWNAEEQITETLFKRKRDLNTLVEQSVMGSIDQQTQAAEKLGEIVQRDPVLLVRLHAVQLLGQLDNSEAIKALQLASKDPDSRVRISAINAWTKKPHELATAQLQEIIGSDTDVDVRLEATKALGTIADESAASALAVALTDSNPAVQMRATQSLEQITGQDIGPDVAAWQAFIRNQDHRTAAADSETSQIR